MSKSLKIRAILFDLDGTLLLSKPRMNDILAQFAIEYRAADTQDDRHKAERWLHYYWAQSAESQFDFEKFGDLNLGFWENHTRRYLIAYGYQPDQAEKDAPEIYRRIVEEYEPHPWIPPDALEVLRSLKEAGFTLGIVSNRYHPLDEELKKNGLEPYISFHLVAGEVNSWKPDTRIFLEAVLRLHIDPCEACYVGDNYYSDVVGARNAGLRPVLFDPDQVFPEAECDVIHKISDLVDLPLFQ